MVFLRRGSKRYYLTVALRDGSYAQVATRVRDRKTAEAMETMLRALGAAGQRQWDLIDAVTSGRCRLAVVYDHWIAGSVAQLRKQLDDVDLAPAVEQWRKTLPQRHHGETIRKYARWSEALFPLGEKIGKDGARVEFVLPALRSKVAEPTHIAGVLEELSGSNTNRRRHHECLTALFSYLAAKKLVPKRLMDDVAKAAKDKKEQPHIARIADVLRFVHAMPTAETKAIAALAEGGGLELPAILSMRGVDVVNRAERIVFAHGSKNIYRDRQAVIDREFWPIVLAYLDAHPVHALGMVFELSDWEVRAVFRQVGAALREKHVPVPAGYAPHKCRHTYTIRHLQQGDDPTLIAENLGHSDTSTLFRDYAKYRPKATEIKRVARAEEVSNG